MANTSAIIPLMTTENAYRRSGKKPHIVSLMLLSAFASMGAILMTPALPTISQYFSISIGSAQLTVTSFLLGYAVGQLLYGPIANRFGRKPALYIGFGIATLGSLFSILASPVESFSLLIAGRLLEALGASAGLVVCFAIINDFYFETQARRVTGLLMLAFAIVPGIGITIGGLLTQYIHWQACFYFLLLYGLCLYYPAWRLPETLETRDVTACRPRVIVSHYWQAFTNKRLVGFSLCSGFSSACLYLFGAEGSSIGINLLHISPGNYGLLALIPYIGTLIGSMVAVRFAQLAPTLVLRTTFLLECLASLVMLICFVLGWVNLISLLLPMMLLCFAHPILVSTVLSAAMADAEDKANSSAVMAFLSVAMPVIMTLILGILHIHAAWIMPVLFFVSLALMLCSYLFLARSKTVPV